MPQALLGAGQVQVLARQVCCAPQPLLQAPQLASELARFTHAPSQLVRPGSQSRPHTPWLHTWPWAQALPQAPQLFGSVERLAQAVPQAVSPVLQTTPSAPGTQRWSTQWKPSAQSAVVVQK